MKRLIRRLFFLGAVAGVVWWVRDRIVPPPQLPAGAPPPFRPVSPQPAAPAATEPAPQIDVPPPSAGDDLTRVKGIGPVYRSRLAAESITSFTALAAADPDVIAGAIDVARSRVEDWQEQARSLG